MSANQPDSAVQSGSEANTLRCNNEARQPCALPTIFPGSRKFHAHQTLEDKRSTPHRRSEDCRLKLPPIGEVKTCHLAARHSLNDLKNKNGDLQLQLIVVKTETRLLRNVLHRHSAALEQYQHLEGSICEIQDSHISEVKAMRKMLGETRNSCDVLGKKLQFAEKELFDSREKIQQLESQILQNPTLLEKEALSHQLEEATQDLKEKDKRIWYLERSNKLLQCTLHRHVAAEQRKISRSNEVFYCLQAQVYDLSKKIEERKREVRNHNISALRFQVVTDKKDTKNKMIQTDKIVSAPNEADSWLKFGHSEPDDDHSSSSTDNLPQRSLAVKYFKRDVQRNRKLADLKEPCDPPIVGDYFEGKDIADTSQGSEEEDQEEDRTNKCPGSCRFAHSIITTLPKDGKKAHSSSQFRRKYIYSAATENLHMGKPAYSNLDQQGSPKDTGETLGDLSRTQPPAEKSGVTADKEDDQATLSDDISSPFSRYSYLNGSHSSA
ncbi:uncharacterized protein LOC129190766 [Dunckerocampus dactyliophorus]|uniref:uncharacterized protein LOC129190766 n=1 Tax=Dunckerocampus dactyliophorus TaxID=161453 RepID=UPI002406F4B7|nr:uncharacterized protein LOC129190766 [Dunckerocampus dactyliophorus]